MREESFGPVIGIQKVGGRRRGAGADERHALRPHRRRATRATRRGRAKLLAQVNAGSVYWNCCDRVSPRLPWSGARRLRRRRDALAPTASRPSRGRRPGICAALERRRAAPRRERPTGAAPRRKPQAWGTRLALFDLDGTLLDGDTDELWCEFLMDEGILARADFESAQPEHRRGAIAPAGSRLPSSAPSTRRRSWAARRRPGPPFASASCRPGAAAPRRCRPGAGGRAIVTPVTGLC